MAQFAPVEVALMDRIVQAAPDYDQTRDGEF